MGEALLRPALLRQEVIQLAADLQCLQLHESADRLVPNENLRDGLLARALGDLLTQGRIVGDIDVFEWNSFFCQQSLCCSAEASIVH